MSQDDGRQSTPGGQTSTLALADVQARLYDLITAPEGVERRLSELGHGRVDLEETVLGSIVRSTTRLSAVERIDIYANMYFYRIRDVLPSFDVVCERVLDMVPAEQAVQRTFELLGRWVTDGLIAMPEVASVPQPCGAPA